MVYPLYRLRPIRLAVLAFLSFPLFFIHRFLQITVQDIAKLWNRVSASVEPQLRVLEAMGLGYLRIEYP